MVAHLCHAVSPIVRSSWLNKGRLAETSGWLRWWDGGVDAGDVRGRVADCLAESSGLEARKRIAPAILVTVIPKHFFSS